MLELLAPAGSPEAVAAAVQNGADAVYLGFGDFNARRSAKNFTQEEAAAAVSYCHLRGSKVYLTLNTLLTDRELPAAARLAGWSEIPAEVVEADDARAVVIATSINLIHRQNLSIIVRGKAYKALLDAKNRNGQRNAAEETFGDSRQRYNARALVAEFFGVTEYEIRKAVKLTYLIPELASILETAPKQLNLACAGMMADYDPESQQAFIEMCRNESYRLNKAGMNYIVSKCPPPSAKRQELYAAWREARARAEKRLAAPPKKISFNRKQFVSYLEGHSDGEIEALFLESLRERVG